MNAPMLVDFQRGGAKNGLLTPQRNGYIYWLEPQRDGSISYLDSGAYVPQDVFKSIDPKTGRPDVDMDHKPGTGKAAKFCPGLWGGKDWPYASYNPKHGMLYIPTTKITATISKARSRAHPWPVVDRRRDPRLPLLGRYEGRFLSASCRPTTSTPASEYGGICTRTR